VCACGVYVRRSVWNWKSETEIGVPNDSRLTTDHRTSAARLRGHPDPRLVVSLSPRGYHTDTRLSALDFYFTLLSLRRTTRQCQCH
jgi:hypothetical protein